MDAENDYDIIPHGKRPRSRRSIFRTSGAVCGPGKRLSCGDPRQPDDLPSSCEGREARTQGLSVKASRRSFPCLSKACRGSFIRTISCVSSRARFRICVSNLLVRVGPPSSLLHDPPHRGCQGLGRGQDQLVAKKLLEEIVVRAVVLVDVLPGDDAKVAADRIVPLAERP